MYFPTKKVPTSEIESVTKVYGIPEIDWSFKNPEIKETEILNLNMYVRVCVSHKMDE